MKTLSCLFRTLLPAVPAMALSVAAAGMAMAQPVQPGPTLYRLEPGSTYQRGCFDPACGELPESIPLLGTFVLTLQGHTVHDFYEISEVNWRTDPDAYQPIIGSGRHSILFQNAVLERMQLNLVGSNFPGIPFSGHVIGPAGFPRFDIRLSANVSPPVDVAVIVLKASPVPPEEIRWYRALGGSAYHSEQRFCGPGSPEALTETRPLTGTFGLTELQTGSPDLAVVNVRWSAPPTNASDPSNLVVTGFGSYSPGAPTQDVQLFLSQDGREPSFTTGSVEVKGDGSELLDFTLTMGTTGCGQRSFRVRAKPN